MKEEQDVSSVTQSQKENKKWKYLRKIILVFSLILFVAMIVGAIVRKFGG